MGAEDCMIYCKASKILIGILFFIASTLISLYIVEQLLPEKPSPVETYSKRLYYSKNTRVVIKKY